jgi:hypothetical protein
MQSGYTSWSEYLVAEDEDVRWKPLATRVGAAVALSGAYGLALGLRAGGLTLVENAVGVPLAAVAVMALGLPALLIVLTLFGTPVRAARLVDAAVRGFVASSIVLAGLAPAVGLYVATSVDDVGAGVPGVIGLLLGGAVGLRAFFTAFGRELRGASTPAKVLAVAAGVGFAIFAVVLSVRVWGSVIAFSSGAA